MTPRIATKKPAPRAQNVGRPDYVELERQSRIQHHATRGFDLNPNPITGYDADGRAIQGGHARNPEHPAWRAGMTAQKYYDMTLKYLEMKKRGLEQDDFRPELEQTEFDDYHSWLKDQKIEDPQK